MDNKPSVLEYLKQFSGWITGIIAFLSMLVGFVVSLRNNLELMTVLIISTSSIAGMIASFRIVTERTPPMIVGGKGLPKYPKFRTFGFVLLIAIPILNLVLLSTNPGKSYLIVSLYGTKTPVPNLLPQITSTTSSVYSLSKTLKTSTTWGCNGFNFVIPPDVDLAQPEFNLANTLYNQKVWDTWDILDFDPVLGLFISNNQPKDGDTIIIKNFAQIVVDSYEPLEYLNIAKFTYGPFYFGHGYCGGGGSGQEFSAVTLIGTNNLNSTSKEYDFFTLQPGESEEFLIPFECGAPGLYRYHITIDVISGEKQEKILAGEALVTYCPKKFSVRAYEEVVTDFATDTNTIHSIVYSGDYELNKEGIYTQSSSGSTITIPWKPCSNAPESYVFDVSTDGVFNPQNTVPVNVRSEPGMDSLITAQVNSGQVIYFEDGPVCMDGLVWWEVSWSERDANNEFLAVRSGWVAEGDGKERWILSCPGKRVAIGLEFNSDRKVESNDWCR